MSHVLHNPTRVYGAVAHARDAAACLIVGLTLRLVATNEYEDWLYDVLERGTPGGPDRLSTGWLADAKMAQRWAEDQRPAS